ncbi:glycerophosphodiester phosphodiesterase [Glaciecola sp. MH2013]|nr:glycerophosphodiester phosphodiesterase [Glaciecola sp. MH2013]
MVLMLVTSCASSLDENALAQASSKTDKAVVIAHRGASGYLPEHTMEAATLAFMQGADYIEQDLVLSKDNVLIVLHDIHIDTVTNVEQVFPKRAREDGRFYAIDFTWDEIQQLYVHERQNLDGKQVYPERYKGNSRFKVASFEQHIALINNLNRIFNKSVGLYPEIKAPEWHLREGKDITYTVFQALAKEGLTQADANIYIQSFYPNTLKRLRDEFSVSAKLVQLVAENDWQETSADYAQMMTAEGVAEIAKYADGVGAWIPQLITPDGKPSGFAEQIEAEGLVLHPYTFRSDDLGVKLQDGNVERKATSHELLNILFNELEVDGVFSDQVDHVKSFLIDASQ